MRLSKLSFLSELSGFNTNIGFLNIITFTASVNEDDITLDWNVDSSHAITTAEYRLNGGSWISVGTVGASGQEVITGQANGDYDCEMRFENDEGIDSQTGIETVTVAQNEPTIDTTNFQGVYRFENNLLNKVDNQEGSEIGTITFQDGIAGKEAVFNDVSAIDTNGNTLANGLFCESGNPFTVLFSAVTGINASGTYIGRCIYSPTEDKTFQILCFSSTIRVILRGATTDFTNVIDGSRHQIGVRWDGAKAELLVDGAVHGTCAVGTATENTDERIYIGARTNGVDNGYYFEGSIDEVQFWGEAITNQVASDLFNYPYLPDVALAFSSFTLTKTDGGANFSWGLSGGRGDLVSVKYQVDSNGWNSVTQVGFTGNDTITGLTNGQQYDIQLQATDGEYTVTSTIKQVTPEPQIGRNFKHQEWLDEVPTNVLSDTYRATMKSGILSAIPSSTATANVVDYGAQDGQLANTEFQNAISALPEGGTLIIPTGYTFYIQDLTITKKIYIDCQGTLKKPDPNVVASTCSHMVKLEATCHWDGGTFDGNRSGWINEGGYDTAGRHYAIQNTAPCVISNVTHNNGLGKTVDPKHYWGGFRSEEHTLYENCYSELSGRCFSHQHGSLYAEDGMGNITTFKGVYWYNCNAHRHEQKGFVCGGSNGFAIADGCTGESSVLEPYRSEALFLFETDSNIATGHQITDILHTAVIKNSTISAWMNYMMIKSAQARWMIFDNADLTSYGKYGDIDVSARLYWAQTKQNTTNQIGTTVLCMDSALRIIDFDDGIRPYTNQCGRYFPVTANAFENRENVSGYNTDDRVSNLFAFNTTFECRNNYNFRGPHEWKKFWAENCTFISQETGEAFVWDYGDGQAYAEYYAFDSCQFTDNGGSNTYIFDRNGSFGGTLHVVNPTGNYRSGVSPESYSTSMPTP